MGRVSKSQCIVDSDSPSLTLCLSIDYIALPYIYCYQVGKWLFYSGMVIILAVMLIRNWRLYKIFYNPRIANRVSIHSMTCQSLLIC